MCDRTVHMFASRLLVITIFRHTAHTFVIDRREKVTLPFALLCLSTRCAHMHIHTDHYCNVTRNIVASKHTKMCALDIGREFDGGAPRECQTNTRARRAQQQQQHRKQVSAAWVPLSRRARAPPRAHTRHRRRDCRRRRCRRRRRRELSSWKSRRDKRQVYFRRS